MTRDWVGEGQPTLNVPVTDTAHGLREKLTKACEGQKEGEVLARIERLETTVEGLRKEREGQKFADAEDVLRGRLTKEPLSLILEQIEIARLATQVVTSVFSAMKAGHEPLTKAEDDCVQSAAAYLTLLFKKATPEPK